MKDIRKTLRKNRLSISNKKNKFKKKLKKNNTFLVYLNRSKGFVNTGNNNSKTSTSKKDLHFSLVKDKINNSLNKINNKVITDGNILILENKIDNILNKLVLRNSNSVEDINSVRSTQFKELACSTKIPKKFEVCNEKYIKKDNFFTSTFLVKNLLLNIPYYDSSLPVDGDLNVKNRNYKKKNFLLCKSKRKLRSNFKYNLLLPYDIPTFLIYLKDKRNLQMVYSTLKQYKKTIFLGGVDYKQENSQLINLLNIEKVIKTINKKKSIYLSFLSFINWFSVFPKHLGNNQCSFLQLNYLFYLINQKNLIVKN